MREFVQRSRKILNLQSVEKVARQLKEICHNILQRQAATELQARQAAELKKREQEAAEWQAIQAAELKKREQEAAERQARWEHEQAEEAQRQLDIRRKAWIMEHFFYWMGAGFLLGVALIITEFTNSIESLLTQFGVSDQFAPFVLGDIIIGGIVGIFYWRGFFGRVFGMLLGAGIIAGTTVLSFFVLGFGLGIFAMLIHDLMPLIKGLLIVVAIIIALIIYGVIASLSDKK